MTDRRPLLWPLLAGGAALILGAAIAVNPQAGFALAAILLAAMAIAAPAGAYVLVALIAALTFKGAATLGLFPPVAIFVDIPLTWAALAVAVLKRRSWSTEARVLTRLLAGLAAAVFASWTFNPSDPIRPFLYLALLGQPFALVAAMLIDPPSASVRRALVGVALGLLLVQIPITYVQAGAPGHADMVQGTLVGAGAGAHAISAVLLIGVMWILSASRTGFGWRIPVAALILPIPILADAKQVIFALPAALVAGRGGQGRFGFALRAAAVVGSVAALVWIVPAGETAVGYLHRTVTEGAGKITVASIVADELTEDPRSLLLGKGPAETVSRAAFMTTDLLLAQDSPLRGLGLRPAALPEEIVDEGGTGSSFYSGISSALGVLGDLGLVGAAAYGGLLVWMFLATRRRPSAEGRAACAGWAIFAVLGLVFDWWEQPPFSVFLAVISGLALTQPAGQPHEPKAVQPPVGGPSGPLEARSNIP